MGKSYPKNDEIFQITLHGELRSNQPLGIVKKFGYPTDMIEWNYKGPIITDRLTRYMKLIQVGYCKDLTTLQQRLSVYGPTPSGQWLEAFREAYPQHDGEGPVGVLDVSWIRAYSNPMFPCIFAVNYSFLREGEPSELVIEHTLVQKDEQPGEIVIPRINPKVGKDFLDYWRWLVFAD